MLNHIDISLKRITPPQQCLNLCRQNIQVERLFYKSSPPIFMAMTIFILSDADDRKMIGTLENSRILWHQWNPLKNGSMMSEE